jgi:hypothetical protein
MPWFRLDDSFHSHPKVIAAGNEAVGLYVRCGTYAAQHLTDGFVGKSIVLLYGSEALAARLVETGLWHRTRGGWNIHDYLDYNPSRETVEKERKAAAERQRRSREAKLSQRDSRRDTAVSHTTPARPDPFISGTGFSSANGRASPQAQPSSRNPSSRPVDEVLRRPPGYRPASPETAHAAAEAARQAMAAKRKPP